MAGTEQGETHSQKGVERGDKQIVVAEPIDKPVSLVGEYMVEGHGLSGLVNMGNTCFMNSALFCLLQCPDLVRYFLSQEFRDDMNPSHPSHEMARQFYLLCEAFWSENGLLVPKSFKRVLGQFAKQFSGWNQHDAHEVLLQILDLLHTGLAYKVKIGARGEVVTERDRMELSSIKRWNEIYKNEYSIIVAMFYGQFLSQISCASCRTVSSSYDPFCAIELPIASTTSLETALEAFVLDEVLPEDWKCENCNQSGKALKRISFWKNPYVLIITLKRFSYGPRGASKDSHLVTFPVSLRLPGSARENEYELFGIVNHTGGTNGGHYYSYCKTLGGDWYRFDDQRVDRVSALVTPNAYVLFYASSCL